MSAYDALLDRYRRYSNLGNAAMLLNWDQQVTMPEGGTPARAQQSAALSAVRHEHFTADETGRLLDEVDETGFDDADSDLDDAKSGLDDAERAVVREIRREYERNADVPSELVDDLAQLQSEAQETWQAAKRDDDFDAFADALVDLKETHRERAAHIDADAAPYAVMFEDGEPSLPLSRVETVFDELRDGLVPLIEDIRASDASVAWPFDGDYDHDAQEALSRDVLDFLGYDWTRGRLDTAPHPFMSGTQFDARITTRYSDHEPLDALTATIHEFGHASYQLGLRDDAYATPLGQPRSSGVHESQSRFFENHVGRTQPFWDAIRETFVEHFPRHDDVSARELYEAANKVRPDNLIRVEADELTYHMHVILRCEIDRAFVEGEIDVDEIPHVWNEKMDEYLGVTPDTDAEGCLQDVHWSYGFAGFQNYTVGSVLAAQIDHAMREDLLVDALVRDGDFEPIHDWLAEHVHEHGCRYTTPELVEEATGEPLTAEYFLDYVTEKYTDLYDL